MKHWIGMAGLHGCLPSTCDVYDSLSDAVASLADLHELGKKRTAILRRNGYIELHLNGKEGQYDGDGNEYAEISECNCDEPWIHSDSTSQKEWEQDHPEESSDA